MDRLLSDEEAWGTAPEPQGDGLLSDEEAWGTAPAAPPVDPRFPYSADNPPPIERKGKKSPYPTPDMPGAVTITGRGTGTLANPKREAELGPMAEPNDPFVGPDGQPRAVIESELPPQPLAPQPPRDDRAAPIDVGEFTNAFVNSAGSQNIGLTAQTMLAYQDLTGDTTFEASANDMLETSKRWKGKIKEPKVPTLRDVDIMEPGGAGRLGDWAKQATGNALGSSVLPLAGGFTGATIGNRMGGKLGGKLGAIGGAFAGSNALNIGSMRETLLEEGMNGMTRSEFDGTPNTPEEIAWKAEQAKLRGKYALAGGMAMSSLDALVPAQLAGKLTGSMRKELEKSIARRLIHGVKAGALKEGLTEGTQEAIQEILGKTATGKSVDPWILLERVVEGAAQGALGGGVMQGATDAIAGPETAPMPSPSNEPSTPEEIDAFLHQAQGRDPNAPQPSTPEEVADFIFKANRGNAAPQGPSRGPEEPAAQSTTGPEAPAQPGRTEQQAPSPEDDAIRQAFVDAGIPETDIDSMSPEVAAQTVKDLEEQGAIPPGTKPPQQRPRPQQPPVAEQDDETLLSDEEAFGPTAGTRKRPVKVEAEQDLEAARTQVNTEPSDAQKEAGNYRLGHLKLHGLDISIENPKGSIRRGKDADGKEWKSPPLPADYGRIKGTKARDGDLVDAYVGPNPSSKNVYIIDQNDLKTGRYDEPKVVFGADSLDQALELYTGSFDGHGQERIGHITETSVEEFQSWLDNGDTEKPFSKKWRRTPSFKAPKPGDDSNKFIEAPGGPQVVGAEANDTNVAGNVAKGRDNAVDGRGSVPLTPANRSVGQFDTEDLAVRGHGDVVGSDGEGQALLPGSGSGVVPEVSLGKVESPQSVTDAASGQLSSTKHGNTVPEKADSAKPVRIYWDEGDGMGESSRNFDSRAEADAWIEKRDYVKNPRFVDTSKKPARVTSKQAAERGKADFEAGTKYAMPRDITEMGPMEAYEKAWHKANAETSVPGVTGSADGGPKELGAPAWWNELTTAGRAPIIAKVSSTLSPRVLWHNMSSDNQKKAIAAYEAQQKPAAKPKHEWRQIGENPRGKPLFEDERGVRSYVEDGVRISEPVGIIPGGGISVTAEEDKETDFQKFDLDKTMEKVAADQEAEKPAFNREDGGSAVIPGTDSGISTERIKKKIERLESRLQNDILPGPEFGNITEQIDSLRAELEARPEEVNETLTPEKTEVGPLVNQPEQEQIEEEENDDADRPSLREAPQEVPDGKQPGDADGDIEDAGGPGAVSDEDGRAGDGDARASGKPDDDLAQTPDRPSEKAGSGAGDTADSRGNRAGRADLSATQGRVEQERDERRLRNYRITDDDKVGQGGAREKIRGNIEAIRTLKTLADERRQASDDEKRILVKYVGWGAFAQDVFAEHKPEFTKERTDLKELLTPEELAAARRSTLNAHYTSPEVIKGMWEAMRHLGFKGGRALEPSAGVGHFIGFEPHDLQGNTDWSAVELDTLTGRILQALYAGSDVTIDGFETFERPKNFYDIAISNVPFGDYKLNDKKYPPFSIHDYFFVKSLDLVRPGGVVAYITSAHTMDKSRDRARKEMDKRADFIGAIRLPGGRKGAFAGNAGTEVTTDIIFLRKRAAGEQASPLAKPWNELKQITTPEGPAYINEYFADNPSMMLGEMRLAGTMYRANEPVLVGTTEGLEGRIGDAAKALLPEGALLPRSNRLVNIKGQKGPGETTDLEESEKAGTKEGGFFLKGDKLFKRQFGQGHEPGFSAGDQDRVRALIGIRDVVNKLLSNQAQGGDRKLNDTLRAELNKLYDKFFKKFGAINQTKTTITTRQTRSGDFVTIRKMPNFSAFRSDPDAFKVSAIEIYDEETGQSKKAAIFNADIIGLQVAPVVSSPADAIAVALNETGHASLPFIQNLLGHKKPEQTVKELGDLVFLNPENDQYETREQYLAGDVVKKLHDAKQASKSDGKFARNVDALTEVQPTPLTRDEISAPFGASWLPVDIVTKFLGDELEGGSITASINPYTKQWSVKGWFDRAAQTKYGTDKMNVEKVVMGAINQAPIRVTYKDANGNDVVDQEGSAEAMVKVRLLRDAWSNWVWKDDNRAIELENLYNSMFNRLAPQIFDGSHLTLPGLAQSIRSAAGDIVPFSLRPHQKNAIWRIIQNGNALLAHVVGAGKTFTMIAAGMEEKRLGLINRPVYVVPNHMLEQFSREFLQAYPGANILVAQKDEMSRDNRKAFVAKVAAQNWDGIIITHDAFGRIGMSDAAYEEYYNQEIEAIEDAIAAARQDEDKKSLTVKQLEKLRLRVEQKLKALADESRKDTGVTFEEMGIDRIYLDEAHLFKNLTFYTRHTRVKGLGQGDAQRATDMFIKIRAIEKRKPHRSAVFATGTPISNTMAEMYTMQRYLQLDTLKEYDIDKFDAWAGTFGEIITQMELSPDGRTFRETTSFSKFSNIPELVAIYSLVADTQTADMLNLPRPKRKNGKITVVEAEPTEQEDAIIQSLVERAKNVRGKRVEKGGDNMLKIVSEGRKVATDGRLLREMPFNPNGKVSHLVNNVHRIYKAGKFPAMAQIIFLDMGVPTSANKAGAAPKPQENDFGETGITVDGDGVDMEEINLLSSKFNLYEDIRNRLIERGIPKAEIAFIHEATDDAKKALMFERVRSGKIRVLLGSTGKMGVGTNVQRLLTAMHHMDAPWKPAEVEQRDGRIERQGNLNEEIEMLRYITKRSFDSFMWQALERKAKFIAQIQAGARGVRSAEDIDTPLPEAAELKAAASGDPRIMEHAELSKKVRDLEIAESTHLRTINTAKREVSQARSNVVHYTETLAKIDKDLEKVTDLSADNFTAELLIEPKGTITKRAEMGEAIKSFLLEQSKKMVRGNQPKFVLGTISGLKMEAGLQMTGDGLWYTPSIHGASEYTPQDRMAFLSEETPPAGIAIKFQNLVGNIEGARDMYRSMQDSAMKSIEKLKAQTENKPFPKQQELDAGRARLKALTADLSEKKPGEKKPDEDEGAPQPKFKPAVVAKPKSYTDEQLAGFHGPFQQIATAILGHRINLEVVNTIPGERETAGLFHPASELIKIAMATSDNPAQTLTHEIFHLMRRRGLITKPEWAAIRRWGLRQQEELQKRSGYTDYYREESDASPQEVVDRVVEEVAADAYGDIVAGRKINDPDGLITRILTKIKNFLEALRNWMGKAGFRTSEEILTDLAHGSARGRTPDPTASTRVLRKKKDPAVQRSENFPVEPGAEGLPQMVIPGAERISTATQTQRLADAKLKPKVAQKGMEIGLFGDEKDQPSLFDDFISQRSIKMPPSRGQGQSFIEPVDQWRDIMASNAPFLSRISKASAYSTRRALEDKMSDMARIEKAIETQTGNPLNTAMRVYQTETLYAGRTGERLEDFRMDDLEPLAKEMHERGVSLEELDEYLYARHAPERNAYIAQINPQFPDGGSGMTDAEAQQVMASFGANRIGDLRAIAARLDLIRKTTLTRLLAKGIIDQPTHDSWDTFYQHYVPLRGFETDPDEEAFVGTGKGKDTRTKIDQAALGRRSRADSPTAYLIAQAQQSIILAEKARVGRSLLRLARRFPNGNLWEVDQKVVKKYLNKNTGLVSTRIDNSLKVRADNVLAVREGGNLYWITLHHKGLAAAFRGSDADSMNAVLSFFLTLQRYYAMMRTGLDPQFFIPNFLRDIQTAGIHISAEQGKSILAKTVKNIPAAMRGVWKGERGNINSPWAARYREFALAGGKVGAFGLDDIEAIKGRIAREVALLQGGPILTPYKMGRSVVKVMMDLNAAVENAVRLSMYQAMRDAGYSQDDAAYAAKEVTVNFNRTGNWSKYMNAAFVFFKASVNGVSRVVKVLSHPGKIGKFARRSAYGLFLAGVAMDIFNGMLAGDDDDDGLNDYDQIPEWIRERNYIIMLPGQKGEYLKIPMPWVYNVFQYAGVNMGRTLRGKVKPMDAAANVALALAQAMNPLQSFSFAQTVTPTQIDPIVELYANKDWKGDPIMPEDRQGQTPTPDSSKYFSTVNPVFKTFTDFMNSATGGDDIRPGALDVSPESVEYIGEFIGGGVVATFNQISSTLGKVWRNEDLDWERVPFVRKVYGTLSSTQSRSDYYAMRDAIHITADQIEATKKDTSLSRAERVAKIKRLREEYPADIRAKPFFDEIDKKLKGLRKIRNAAGDKNERHNKAQETMDSLMAKARKRYRMLQERSP